MIYYNIQISLLCYIPINLCKVSIPHFSDDPKPHLAIQVTVSVATAAREPRPIFHQDRLVEVCAAVNPKNTGDVSQHPNGVIHGVITQKTCQKKHLKKKPISIMFGQLFEHLIVENG